MPKDATLTDGEYLAKELSVRKQHYATLKARFEGQGSHTHKCDVIMSAFDQLLNLPEGGQEEVIKQILDQALYVLNETSEYSPLDNKLVHTFNKDLNRLKAEGVLDIDPSLKAQFASDAYEREYKNLRHLLQKFPDRYKWTSIRGLIEIFRAWMLKRRVNWLMSKLDDDGQQTKIKVMRSAVKSYIQDHAVYDDKCLSGFLIKEFYGYDTSKDFGKKLEKETFYLGKKAYSDLGKVCVEKGISLGGKKVKLLSQISDLPLGRTEDKDLYAQFKLKCLAGRPADRYMEALPDGWYSYVILSNDEVRYLPTNFHEETPKGENTQVSYAPFKKFRSHSQIAGGQNAKSAGNFKIENGVMVEVNGGSGHYGTRQEKFVSYTKEVFTKMGIHMSDCKSSAPDSPLTRDEKFSRFKRKIHSMGKALYLPGEVAEERPSVEKAHSRFRSRIPTY